MDATLSISVCNFERFPYGWSNLKLMNTFSQSWKSLTLSLDLAGIFKFPAKVFSQWLIPIGWRCRGVAEGACWLVIAPRVMLGHNKRMSSTCDGTTFSDRTPWRTETRGPPGTSGIAEAGEMARFGDRKMGFHDFVQEDARMSHSLAVAREETLTRHLLHGMNLRAGSRTRAKSWKSSEERILPKKETVAWGQMEPVTKKRFLCNRRK